ncbi:MFS transporter [Candidatus Enterococcus lemimoniae]|uniref:Major facilitator superfamily (MFS) profile domain-containing protein n=1 Tax=Candidatus Enterococcus lemimoniae TaxID=1834167 RepID=A0ABZ2T6F9_9ENTE
MKDKVKAYYILSSFIAIATQLFSAILYIFLINENYSYTEISIYLSLFWLICTVCELPGGVLVDTLGSKKIMQISFLLRGVGLGILIVPNNFPCLLLSAVLTGIAEALASGSAETWISNEVKKDNSKQSIQPILAKNNIISPFFGMLSGFIGAQLLPKINMKLPFIISAIMFISLSLLVKTLIHEPERKKRDITEKSSVTNMYKRTIRNSIVDIKKVKYFWFYMLLFVIPSILDIGPSNQWSVVINENISQLITGYFWVAIGMVTILSNVIITRYFNNEKTSTISVIYFFIVFDSIILILISLSYINAFFILIHVFIYGILNTLIMAYIHDHIVENNNSRNSIISTFYTLEALIVSALLPINGYLSDKLNIKQTWLIFVVLSMALVWILTINLKKRSIGNTYDRK